MSCMKYLDQNWKLSRIVEYEKEVSIRMLTWVARMTLCEHEQRNFYNTEIETETVISSL